MMMDYRGFPSLSHPHPLLSLPAILFSAKDDQDPVSLHFASFPRGRILVFFFAFLFRLKSGNHLRGCGGNLWRLVLSPGGVTIQKGEEGAEGEERERDGRGEKNKKSPYDLGKVQEEHLVVHPAILHIIF
ncbi:hypothetical protein ACMYSQ_012025 [Aspergillus niger]